MRPDMKNDRYEISNRFEFYFCLYQKVILGRPEILVCNSLAKLSMFILKTNVEQKRSIEKQLLLTGTSNILLLADSSTTSITYKLGMLLIKGTLMQI